MPLKSQPVSCQSPSFVLLQRISPFFETVASAHLIESIATPSMANLFFGSSLVPASFPFFGAANENSTAMESNRIVVISFFIKISLYINRFEKPKHVINFLTPFLTFSKLVKNIKLFILLK